MCSEGYSVSEVLSAGILTFESQSSDKRINSIADLQVSCYETPDEREKNIYDSYFD